MVRQAFRAATTGTPGPVHLQFRGNEGQVDGDEGEMEPMVEPEFSRVPPFRPEPDQASVLAAVKVLQSAARPVIVAGGGVRASGAARELVALAEALQIPVVTSLNGKDSIPGTHPLSCGVVGTYSRESANKVVNAADLICFVGSTTGGMTTHFWAVPKIGTPAIQIDINPEALGVNYPLQARVNGDAKVTLSKMLAACDKSTAGKRKAWVEQAQSIVKEWYAKYKPMLESDAAPINPARICHELSKHVPDDAIVVVDTGHAGMWMGGMYDLRTDTQSYMRSAGHLGWAFPAGLGAKCGAPDRPVVTFTGDAGFWYHIGDIETAVRWKINAVTVVNNNGGGNQSSAASTASMAARRPSRRASCGPSARPTSPASPRRWARSASASRSEGLPAALAQALAANRPGDHRRRHRHRRAGADGGGLSRCSKDKSLRKDRGDGVAQTLRRNRLRQHRRARHHLVDVGPRLLVAVGRDEDDRRAARFADAARGLDAIHPAGKPDIHENKINIEIGGLFDGAVSVWHKAADFQLLLSNQ
jgi:acetolactate synthase-1/2/3 large subunit